MPSLSSSPAPPNLPRSSRSPAPKIGKTRAGSGLADDLRQPRTLRARVACRTGRAAIPGALVPQQSSIGGKSARKLQLARWRLLTPSEARSVNTQSTRRERIVLGGRSGELVVRRLAARSNKLPALHPCDGFVAVNAAVRAGGQVDLWQSWRLLQLVAPYPSMLPIAGLNPIPIGRRNQDEHFYARV